MELVLVRCSRAVARSGLAVALLACASDPIASPAPMTPTVIAAAGDIANCGSAGDEATALVLDAIDPHTILTLGDNVYEDGASSEFSDCYEPSWGRHRAVTRPSPGNHDYHVAGAAGYFAYFGAQAGPAGRGYYSFDIGAWHLISLNSNVDADPGSEQITWLRSDLAASSAACTLAYWHHPVISSGEHGNDSRMREIWRVLDSAGVDLILAGHDHDYERFGPQSSTGVADANGVRQFVVGTGGTPLGVFETIRANSEVRNSDTWGVLKLTLRAERYDWEFVPVAGSSFTDTGSADCVETESS